MATVQRHVTLAPLAQRADTQTHTLHRPRSAVAPQTALARVPARTPGCTALSEMLACACVRVLAQLLLFALNRGPLSDTSLRLDQFVALLLWPLLHKQGELFVAQVLTVRLSLAYLLRATANEQAYRWWRGALEHRCNPLCVCIMCRTCPYAGVRVQEASFVCYKCKCVCVCVIQVQTVVYSAGHPHRAQTTTTLPQPHSNPPVLITTLRTVVIARVMRTQNLGGDVQHCRDSS